MTELLVAQFKKHAFYIWQYYVSTNLKATSVKSTSLRNEIMKINPEQNLNQYINMRYEIWHIKGLDLPSSGALLSTKAYAQNLLTGPL